jgi:alpha-tubulin suppressor-like RCC1 family protein
MAYIAPSITETGDVPVGASVRHIAAGEGHTCALLVGDRIRCWGSGSFGQLGYDSTENVGDGFGPSIVEAATHRCSEHVRRSNAPR